MALVPNQILSRPRLAVLSQRGQMQVMEPGSGGAVTATSMMMYQVETAGYPAVHVAAAKSGQVLAVADKGWYFTPRPSRECRSRLLPWHSPHPLAFLFRCCCFLLSCLS
jgi:hypothetical protein